MNYVKLKIAMLENNVTNSDIIKECGISSSCFYNKLRGVSEFTQSEISVIRKLLHLSDEEVCNIFFSN